MKSEPKAKYYSFRVRGFLHLIYLRSTFREDLILSHLLIENISTKLKGLCPRAVKESERDSDIGPLDSSSTVVCLCRLMVLLRREVEHLDFFFLTEM